MTSADAEVLTVLLARERSRVAALLEALKGYDNAFTDLNPDDQASRFTMRKAIIVARDAIARATRQEVTAPDDGALAPHTLGTGGDNDRR